MRVSLKSRLTGVALAALMLLALAACGKKDGNTSSMARDISRSEADTSSVDSSSLAQSTSDLGSAASASAPEGAAPSSDVAVSSVSGAEAQPGEPGAQAPAPTAAAPAEVSAGKFINISKEIPEARAPYLALLGDAAEFQVNSGMGMGIATGTYSITGNSLVFNIASLETEHPFRTEDVTTLTFTVLDSEHLELATEVYGLSRTGDIFTLQGAGPYDPSTAAPTPAAPDPTVSAPPASSLEPTASSVASVTSVASVAASDVESLPAESAVVSAPGEETPASNEPPSRMQPGESFTLTDVAIESILFDSELLEAAPEADGTSVTFTALAKGKAALQYALNDGTTNKATIVIAEKGVAPWLLIAVGVAALAIGSVITFLLLGSKKKKAAATDDAGAEAQVSTAAERRNVIAAKKRLKKATADAQKKEQQATNATKAAAKAAEKVLSAEEGLTKAEEKAAVAEQKSAEAARKAAEAAVAAAEKRAAQAEAAADKKTGKKKKTKLDKEAEEMLASVYNTSESGTKPAAKKAPDTSKNRDAMMSLNDMPKNEDI